MAYIGRSLGQGVRNRFIYTATAGQTTFSGSDDNGGTLVYTDGTYVDVNLNGVELVSGTDYTATSGTSIVLNTGASLNDTLSITVYDVFSVADLSDFTNTLKIPFTNADGSTTTIPLATGQKIPFTNADGTNGNFSLTN